MHLILPSASTTAVLTVSLHVIIDSIAASILDPKSQEEYGVENNFSMQECTYVGSTHEYVQGEADVGILCNSNQFCIPDSSSSLGGRCASRFERNSNHGKSDQLHVEERGLETCIKCVGTKACEGLPQAFIDAKIGCGSCIGTSACHGLSSEYK